MEYCPKNKSASRDALNKLLYKLTNFTEKSTNIYDTYNIKWKYIYGASNNTILVS